MIVLRRISYYGLLLFINLFLVLLSGCSSRSVQEENDPSLSISDESNSKFNMPDIKVGYSSPSQNAPFYVVLSGYIREYAERYGMKFAMADGQDDIIKQITSMEDLLTTGLDVLILNPLDHKALVPAVNAAAERGIPVFIVDSQIDENADYITSVQASNEGNGELIGEYVVTRLGDASIQVALISGSQGNPVGREKRLGFVRGFVETQLMIQGRSDLDIVAQGWGNWTLLGGIEAMEDILVAFPDINVLVAENDAMGMGALKAIKEAGRSGEVLVVAFDGQKEAYELIEKGDFGATALNSPKELARLVVESVVNYLNGEQVNKVIYTPAILITEDNVDKYYDPEALF
jgi:ribose transport system substrate-binding protein